MVKKLFPPPFSLLNNNLALLSFIFIYPTIINMRSGLACLLGLAGVALTNALSLEKRDNPAVLAMPMVRDTSRQLSKRSKTVDANLDNDQEYVGLALTNETACRLTSLPSTLPMSQILLLAPRRSIS